MGNVGTDINKENFPFAVLGNKADRCEEIMVSMSRAEAWCKTKKNVSLFETSALSQKNLNKAFERVAIAASGEAPSVALVDVKDLDTNPLISADSDDGKNLEEEPEPEPEDEPANAIDAEDHKYENEEDEVVQDLQPLAWIRRESPEEASKRGRKKTSKHKNKKKSSRHSSIHGSHGSSKYSHKDNQSSQTSSKHSKKESRYENETKNKRKKRRNSVVD